MVKLARLRASISFAFSLLFVVSVFLLQVLTLPYSSAPSLFSCATLSRDQGFYTNKAPIFIFKQYFARTHTKLIWNWLWLCALDIPLNKYTFCCSSSTMEWAKPDFVGKLHKLKTISPPPKMLKVSHHASSRSSCSLPLCAYTLL